MLPPKDLEIASAHDLTFEASVKHRRGGRWADVLSGVGLDAAYQRAVSEAAFERAVFVLTQTGGMLYWTSRFPTTFNSEALAQAVHERSKGDG